MTSIANQLTGSVVSAVLPDITKLIAEIATDISDNHRF